MRSIIIENEDAVQLQDPGLLHSKIITTVKAPLSPKAQLALTKITVPKIVTKLHPPIHHNKIAPIQFHFQLPNLAGKINQPIDSFVPGDVSVR